MTRVSHLYISAAALLVTLTLASSALALITPVPPTITVARGESASRSITYQFTGLPPDMGSIVSEGGVFMAGAETLGGNNTGLTFRTQGFTAVGTEALVVPAGVIQKALARRTNMITYHRIFTGTAYLEAVDVTIIIASEAASDFEIKRLELYFENRRGEITVDRNRPKLKAWVDVRYAGSGILQAYWEVDGRVLATVNQHLTYAGLTTLESPDIPALPTFEPGTHVVRFVITNPSPEITVPTIAYFVLPEEAGALLMETLMPADGEVVDGLPASFRWKGTGLASMYMVRFFEDPDASPVFSAYTNDTSYALPAGVVPGTMSKGVKYYWSVTALGEDGSTVGESRKAGFTLK